MLNMVSSSIAKPPQPLFTNPLNFTQSKNPTISRSKNNNFRPKSRKPRISPLSCLTINQPITIPTPNVSQKVQSLDFEFKSLPKPIERVKRLLEYASLLPPFDESLRILENRVVGCTAQVWLEVKMDDNGIVRFCVDSDSEITKGFCACLIWALDGAEADEVLSVGIDDLVEMNVGLPSRGNSRVNTWHNVLISMQKRTRDLVEERRRFEAFSNLVGVNGSCEESQIIQPILHL